MQLKKILTIALEHYSEGPAIDSDGNIYCTTLSGGTILKFDRDMIPGVWARGNCPNGQVILSNGDHLVCDSQSGSVVRYDRQGSRICNEISGHCAGEEISVPNDVIPDGHNGFYFTDSIRHRGKVGYKSADGFEKIIASDLDYPNGLVLSHDGSNLFVAESYRNRILSIPLVAPGISDPFISVFANLPVHASGKAASNLPDGLYLDRHDRLWVAHYGMEAVQVLNNHGTLLQTIPMPFPLVSNICFSEDETEAIITGGTGEPGPGVFCRATFL